METSIFCINLLLELAKPTLFELPSSESARKRMHVQSYVHVQSRTNHSPVCMAELGPAPSPIEYSIPMYLRFIALSIPVIEGLEVELPP